MLGTEGVGQRIVCMQSGGIPRIEPRPPASHKDPKSINLGGGPHGWHCVEANTALTAE
jgi:hypothetical protein